MYSIYDATCVRRSSVKEGSEEIINNNVPNAETRPGTGVEVEVGVFTVLLELGAILTPPFVWSPF